PRVAEVPAAELEALVGQYRWSDDYPGELRLYLEGEKLYFERAYADRRRLNRVVRLTSGTFLVLGADMELELVSSAPALRFRVTQNDEVIAELARIEGGS